MTSVAKGAMIESILAIKPIGQAAEGAPYAKNHYFKHGSLTAQNHKPW